MEQIDEKAKDLDLQASLQQELQASLQQSLASEQVQCSRLRQALGQQKVTVEKLLEDCERRHRGQLQVLRL